MKREDWERIGSLFDETLTREGAERDEFLSSLGEKLEEELRSLLAAHEGRGRFDELADRMSGPGAGRLLRLGPGDPIGPYRVVGELGTGGMATVYRAQDLKHERQVAVKVLRPELAAVLGADRFVQEIRTIARLQHPHILPLLDSGEAEGLLYYVMPYVEGETLRDKLNRETQLGIEEAVRITTEVADALDYAHRHNVVHRDIKPENILLHDGRPLVADFGIALAVSAAAGERITETGLSLGTPQYMSPEQATAEKDVTQRSDIYSLGCVLYEMLTGEPPHTGSTAQQILRKIVTDDARPVTDLRTSVPPNVAAAAAKSLERLPADRFESARTFAAALGDPTFTTPSARAVSGVARPRERWKRLTVGLAAIAAVAILSSVWSWFGPAAGDLDRRVVEFYLEPPDATMAYWQLVLSPDGRRLVVFDWTRGTGMYQRMLDASDWGIIPGTEAACCPFFSPDGEWLGFYQEGYVKRIPVQGGPAQIITRASPGFMDPPTWGPDNTVVFSTFEAAPRSTWALFRVSADGGMPEQLTTPDTALRELGHISPHYLPGGKVLLFTAVAELKQPFVVALSLESGRVSRLTPGMTPRSVGNGRVVYITSDGSVVAQTFNPRTLALEGSPRPVADGVEIWWGQVAPYTVSSDGSLAYERRARGDQVLLINRDGETRPLFSSGLGWSVGVPRFSPTGDRIAFVRGDGTHQDVWVYSLAEGTAQRLTFEGGYDPTWTTDGRSIGYSAIGKEAGSYASLYLRAADGTGAAKQIVVADDHLWQMDFAPGDSEVVFFSRLGPWNTVFRASRGSDSHPVPLIETEYFVTDPALSPDGRWLAYTSNESGTVEVYVRSYPDMGPPTVVSVGGGCRPAWSADGDEIFYWGAERLEPAVAPYRLIAASVRYDGFRIAVVRRADLFHGAPFRESYTRNYDVHPNGQEFVIVGRPRTRIVVRVNALAFEP